MMKFKRIYLLSEHEGRALSTVFGTEVTVIRAPNGFGKSALLKSLYDTFGAEPHKIDSSWRNAGVISLVDFTVDDEPYSILKFVGIFFVFDGTGKLVFQTSSVMDLGKFFAELLDFRLLMTDQKQNVVIPPPAYVFAPFYVDQDKSWTTAWEPFKRMFLPRSTEALAEYHSGLKPNEYYIAKAERDRLGFLIRDKKNESNGLTEAIEHLRSLQPETPLSYDLKFFEQETNALIFESDELNSKQSEFRAILSNLQEEKLLWETQRQIVKSAIAEFEDIFKGAIGHSVDISCPTCGAHYVNDIAEKFGIAVDVETLIATLHRTDKEIKRLETEMERVRSETQGIEASLSKIRSLLDVQHEDLTLGDILEAEGRNTATGDFRKRISDIKEQIGGLLDQQELQSDKMKSSFSKERRKLINDHFSSRLNSNSIILDVRFDPKSAKSLTTGPIARGSEGPRGLAAYYYAFLSTEREFGSSAFCPIVIDAPNQQGQDPEHLQKIISFLISNRPANSQLILGVEEAIGINVKDADIVEVGKRKNQLLQEDEFVSVRRHISRYIANTSV